MKVLFALLMVLGSSISYAQHYPYPERVYPQICHNGEMVSNQGLTIYRFTFPSDCMKALNQSRLNHGRFCDDGNLVRGNGTVAHRYTFGTDCTRGLEHLRLSKYSMARQELQAIRLFFLSCQVFC